MSENPPLTAAAIVSAANAVRTAAAREDRLAQHAAVVNQWNTVRMNGVEKPRPVPLSESDFEQVKKIGEAAGATADQINDLAYAIAAEAMAPIEGPITYTNRAARRARAKAEREPA